MLQYPCFLFFMKSIDSSKEGLVSEKDLSMRRSDRLMNLDKILSLLKDNALINNFLGELQGTRREVDIKKRCHKVFFF